MQLVRSPLTTRRELAAPVRHERDLGAEIDQVSWELVKLFEESRTLGVSLPKDLATCLELLAEYMRQATLV